MHSISAMNTPKKYFIRCDDDPKYYRTVQRSYNIMTRKNDILIDRDVCYGEPSDTSIKEITKKELMLLKKGKNINK